MTEPAYKTLILYYSMSGNTASVARAMADEIGGEAVSVKPEREIRARGILKYLIGGWQALRAKTPELQPLSVDPNAYDLLLFGTPLWGARMTPAMRSFLSQWQPRNGQRVALFVTSGGGQAGRAIDDMRELLPSTPVVGTAVFSPDRDGAQAETEARRWAREIVGRASA